VDLVTQTEADYKNMGLDVGVFYGTRKEYGKTHTICTWQSLNNLGKAKKGEIGEIVTTDEFFDGVIAIIIDECFDGDTEISTPSGKIKIKDLIPGDKIINLCEETKIYKEDTIVKVHRNLTKSSSSEMLELTFDEGQVIKVTSEHKFLTTLGWVKAKALTEDMEVIDISTYN
jgi:intein/homing endonuclease